MRSRDEIMVKRNNPQYQQLLKKLDEAVSDQILSRADVDKLLRLVPSKVPGSRGPANYKLPDN